MNTETTEYLTTNASTQNKNDTRQDDDHKNKKMEKEKIQNKDKIKSDLIHKKNDLKSPLDINKLTTIPTVLNIYLEDCKYNRYKKSEKKGLQSEIFT